jgi:DNA polymerase III subunit delta'
MQWNAILGHGTQYNWFHNASEQHRLATSFLFVGPDGIGKRTFAKMLAKSLLCRKTPLEQLNACGDCEDCAQVEARDSGQVESSTHPDLIELAKPADKSNLPLDLLIGDPDNRMREGLCHDISLRPFGGRRKVAIIDDADYLNAEGANALLKTLEEPPINAMLILISTSLQRQLPTIRSRCQTVLFQPLAAADLAKLLILHQVVDDPAVAEDLAAMSGGSISQAKLLNDPDLREFRTALLQKLSNQRMAMADLAKTCGAIIDAAGKESKLKRDRMKLVVNFAAQYYRELALRFSPGAAERDLPPVDRHLSAAIDQARDYWSRGAKAAIACWDTCLQTIDHVDRNANQASLLEWWVARLAEESGS